MPSISLFTATVVHTRKCDCVAPDRCMIRSSDNCNVLIVSGHKLCTAKCSCLANFVCGMSRATFTVPQGKRGRGGEREVVGKKKESSVNFTWDYPISHSLDTWFYRGDAGRITLQFPRDNSLSGSSQKWAFGPLLTKSERRSEGAPICLQLWWELSMEEREDAFGVCSLRHAAAWLENWMTRECKAQTEAGAERERERERLQRQLQLPGLAKVLWRKSQYFVCLPGYLLRQFVRVFAFLLQTRIDRCQDWWCLD